MSMWREVLINCGIDEALLVRKGTACPICGGQDRFTFDDRTGKGDYYCRGCDRPGNGFSILMGAYNIEFQEALKMAQEAGLPITMSQTNHTAVANYDNENNKQQMYDVIQQCQAAAGTPAGTYLRNRGLYVPPPISGQLQCLYAPSVEFFNKDTNQLEHHKAMVWKMRSFENLSRFNIPKGADLLIHKTLITEEGGKAVGKSSKQYSKRWISRDVDLGSMFAPITHSSSQYVILSEGIENTIAAYQIIRDEYGMDCSSFAFTNQGNMKKFAAHNVPPYLQNKSFLIFADNDSSFIGQVAANTCAMNIMKAAQGTETVRVITPPDSTYDWADVLAHKLPAMSNIQLV